MFILKFPQWVFLPRNKRKTQKKHLPQRIQNKKEFRSQETEDRSPSQHQPKGTTNRTNSTNAF